MKRIIICLLGSLASLSSASPWHRGNPKFDALEAYLFPAAQTGTGKVGVRTDGFVVLQNGRLEYERYGLGYTAQTPHLSWSVTKSFTNAVVGLAVKDGKMKVDDSVCKYFPEYKGTAHCGITIDHLLRHSSGLQWDETYEDGQSLTESSVLSMLYGAGHLDMGKFALDHKLLFAAGTRWVYSSGGTNAVMAAVQKAIGVKDYSDYPFKRLFEPLGMKSVVWERDGKGVFVGSSYLFATPQDMAKFGQLFLNDGVWGGKRILPEGWVAYSTAPSEALKNPNQPGKEKASAGASWWLNKAVPEGGLAAPWPKAPGDIYAALGHWGQSILVVPSKNLVVVRAADDRDGKFDEAKYVELLTEVAR